MTTDDELRDITKRRRLREVVELLPEEKVGGEERRNTCRFRKEMNSAVVRAAKREKDRGLTLRRIKSSDLGDVGSSPVDDGSALEKK